MPKDDLGKVMTKVLLYDEIQNVELDSTKLRRSYSWKFGVNGKKDGLVKFGVTFLQIPSIASCVLPTPIYEPLDNQLVTNANADTTLVDDVFWRDAAQLKPVKKEVGEGDAQTLEDVYYYDPSSIPCKRFSDMIINGDKHSQTVTSENGATWKSKKATVFRVESDNPDDIDFEYENGPIKYRGYWFADDDEADESQDREDAAREERNEFRSDKDTTEEPATDTPVVKRHLVQSQSRASVWWSVKTDRPWKGEGWPFWLAVSCNSLNVRSKSRNDNDSLGKSVISIKIRDGMELKSGDAKKSDYSEFLGDVELIVESTGRAWVEYEIKKSVSREVDEKPPGAYEDTSKKKLSEWRKAEIELDSLKSILTQGRKTRIGFMSIFGRLCLYDENGNYQFITFLHGDDRRNRVLDFNLDTDSLAISGYGCAVSILASRMTFTPRGYFVLRDMPIDSRGYELPETETNINGRTYEPGDWSDGRLISMPVSQQSIDRNTAKMKKKSDGKLKKKSGKQYSATFRQYQESLYTPPTEEDQSKTSDQNDSNGSIDEERFAATNKEIVNDENNYRTGAYNMWGRFHFVRYEKPIPSVRGDKKFWLAYFETDILRLDAVDNLGNPIEIENEDDNGKGPQQAVIESLSGFPMMYATMAKVPEKKGIDRTLMVRTHNIVDITNDVVSISVDSNVDSNQKPGLVESKATVKVFDRGGDYQDYLAKARGIKIWMKWYVGPEVGESGDVDFTDADLVFSGIAFGRSRQQAPGQEYVTFECFDNWIVLQNMQIKNSPFYDGFSASAVIDDLCKRGGITYVDDVDRTKGRSGGPRYYWLGQGTVYYDPKYRFKSEQSLKDCIVATNQNFETYLLFDVDGQLLLRPIPGGFRWEYTNSAWNPEPRATYYTDLDSADNYWQVIIDGLDINSTLSSSLYNSYMLMSVSRETGDLVIESDRNLPSLIDPSSVGYLGFIKEVRIQRPDLGGEPQAMRDLLRGLKASYSTPGFEVQFNTPGHIPSYQGTGTERIYPGDFINLKRDTEEDGVADIFQKRFRVTKISHSYEASSNKWTTNIGAYQITSIAFNPSQKKR